MAETAEKHFGTTNDVRESGYITVNGKMLDFSGRHWGGVNRGSRQVDHEDIGEILPDDFDTFATKPCAVLVETVFIDTASDLNKVKTAAGRRKVVSE